MTQYTVASPCNGVCTLDPRDKVCLGCFRTGAEIAGWRASKDSERRQILKRVEERKIARR